jgi:hypothetical protein
MRSKRDTDVATGFALALWYAIGEKIRNQKICKIIDVVTKRIQFKRHIKWSLIPTITIIVETLWTGCLRLNANRNYTTTIDRICMTFIF